MKRIYDSELKSLKVKQVPSNEWAVFFNGHQVTDAGVKSVADAKKYTLLRDLNWHGSLLVNEY